MTTTYTMKATSNSVVELSSTAVEARGCEMQPEAAPQLEAARKTCRPAKSVPVGTRQLRSLGVQHKWLRLICQRIYRVRTVQRIRFQATSSTVHRCLRDS